MRTRIATLMAVCFLALSLSGFAQSTSSGDTMKHDDNMKHDSMSQDPMKKDSKKAKKAKKTKDDQM